MPRQLSSLLAAFLLLAPAAVAAPPTITRVLPRGAERGKAVEVIVTGTNLTAQSKLQLPFKGTAAVLPDAKPNPTQVRFQVTVDPSVPLGVYPVRLATEDGVAPLFFFCVDHFPNINEVEDNSTFARAQKITVPAVVNGECAGGDVDFFRFTASKGQRLVIETEAARLGSGVLPQLRLTDDKQRFLAADDSQSVRGDCRIVFVAPTDGDYVVEISDSRYKGAAPPFYRLKIGDYDVVGEVFPPGGKRGDTVNFTLRGGSLANEVRVQRRLDDALMPGLMPLALEGVVKPGALPPMVAVGDLSERLWVKNDSKDPRTLDVLAPITINSRLERKGDVDRFQFPVEAGQRYRIAVQAEALGSSMDGVLRVLDQTGKQLALVDDVDIPSAAPNLPATKGADPSLDLLVPAGVSLLMLELRDQRQRGGVNFVYRLTITPIAPDFDLRLAAAEINVPRGGSALLTVPVIRHGYMGPLQLTVPDLPAGLTVQGGDVPASGGAGLLVFTSTPLRVEGKATIDGKEVRRRAQHQIVLSREVNPAASIVTITQLAVGLTAPDPFTVQGPAMLEVVQGFPVQIPITLTRGMMADKLPIEVSAVLPTVLAANGQPAPNGFAVKPVVAAPGAAPVALTLTTTAAAPAGKITLALQGKAKIANVDRIVVGQAVPLIVHRPFIVEFPEPTVKLTPGQLVALKGKLTRQPIFKDAVQLRLDGLPAGVTLAKPLAPVPGNAGEFQIELKVDPKYALPTANLTLNASANIGGMPYAHPPVVVAASLK
jgi:hypothetical protein